MGNYRAVINQAPKGSEIQGGMVVGLFDNLTSDSVNPILEKYGLSLDTYDSNGWYSLQLLYDITREAGQSNYVVEVALGKAFAPDVIKMFNIQSIEDYLERGMNQTARLGVRYVPDDFKYEVTKIAPHHYRIRSNVPTPNGLVYGFIWESLRLLKQAEETFSVNTVEGSYFDSSEPATFEVRWGLGVQPRSN